MLPFHLQLSHIEKIDFYFLPHGKDQRFDWNAESGDQYQTGHTEPNWDIQRVALLN